MAESEQGFITTSGTDFIVSGKPTMLRGFGIANWLNLEHFMVGLPGTHSQIASAIEQAYGPDRAARFWKKFRECYFAEADVRWLADLGVNTVRMPFNYHLFESDERPQQFDEAGFADLDAAIELCAKVGIYVILDLHAAPGGQNPDWHSDNAVGEALFWEQPDCQSRTIALWKFIAEHYRDQPWVGGYDLLNEAALTSGSGELVPAFYERARRAVREVDEAHLVILEGDRYAQNFSAFEPSDDPNLAYSFHHYPFIDRLTGSADHPFVSVEEAVKRVCGLDELRERLGRPLWCGETGAPLDSANRAEEEELIGEMIRLLERERISWSLWPHKDARAMGALHITEDSPWMQLARRARGDWKLWDDFADANREVERLSARDSASLTGKVRRRLMYRLIANRQLVLVERLKGMLETIPFAELMTYPESFRLEACEPWPALIDLVRAATGRAS